MTEVNTLERGPAGDGCWGSRKPSPWRSCFLVDEMQCSILPLSSCSRSSQEEEVAINHHDDSSSRAVASFVFLSRVIVAHKVRASGCTKISRRSNSGTTGIRLGDRSLAATAGEKVRALPRCQCNGAKTPNSESRGLEAAFG